MRLFPDSNEKSAAPKNFLRTRRGVLISLFFVTTIIAGLSLSLNTVFVRANTPSTTTNTLLGDADAIQKQAARRLHITYPSRVRSFAASAANVPAFNNTGISSNSLTTAANFDSVGYSYSAEELMYSNLQPSLQFSYDGIKFTWPNHHTQNTAGDALPDNYQASGQVLPLDASAATVGFVGSANGGAASGNAVVTYDDGTTQTFTLGFSDWTLGGGKQTISYGNQVVAAQMKRNAKSGPQAVKTYLFYAKVNLDLKGGTRKAVSVTLPTLNSGPQLHIFAYASRNTANYTSPYNNVGMSHRAYPITGNFDGGGYSYQADAIGWNPGAIISTHWNNFNNSTMNFVMPDTLGGVPDNYVAKGQTIPVTPVANATKIGFIGAADHGPSFGTGQINYTDGSKQAFTLSLSDWTLSGYTRPPSYGNQYFYGSSYRNSRAGEQKVSTFLFYTDANLNPTKTVASVTLPSTTNQGSLHVFSIATGQAGFFDNVAVTSDAIPTFGNFDGGNRSYSYEALKNAGINFVEENNSLKLNGISYSLFSSFSSLPDNWTATGQAIAINQPVANANTLGFLGSSTGGNQTGTVVVHYTDGSTQNVQLGLTDWCATSVQNGNGLAAVLPYRNTPTGRQNIKNYLYTAEVSIDPTREVDYLVLPNNSNMHIFSVGARAGLYNHTAQADDNFTFRGNFDGGFRSYSAQLVYFSGLVHNVPETFNGVEFIWGNTIPEADNIQLKDQTTIPVTPVTNAQKLAFIGSAAGGNQTVQATINYADGTTQAVSVTFNDWCSATPQSNNNQIFREFPYRNTLAGKQNIKNYLYYTDVTLTAGKVVQSVTFAKNANVHIFSFGTK